MKILIIEDDLDVLAFIEKGFKELQYEVTTASDGKHGLDLVMNNEFDIIILDLMLPNLKGVQILSIMRTMNNETPVIILSALANVEEKIEVLRTGADDYLVKPFDFKELATRVEVLLKRAKQPSNDNNYILKANDVEINILTREVHRENKKIILHNKEFNLLEYFVRNQGQLITRKMLLENVWKYDFDPGTNIIDVHISRLRSKINKGFSKKVITTVWGNGYKFE